MIPNRRLLNVPITCLPFEEQIMLMLRWAKIRDSKTVCLANVHMIMEAYKSPPFKKVLDRADLVTPDGKPLVWMLHLLGIHHQNQVAGMDVFLSLCDLAESAEIPVYFLGSTEDILSKMKQKLNQEYPILKIVGMKSIPFMSTEEILLSEDKQLIEEINNSGAGIVFVCLGCPKQEIWMSHYQGHLNSVMVGVGAVFSMYAGITPRAPYLLQHVGLEWLYRLAQEPKRLWYRYGSTIPPFVCLSIRQLLVPYKNKEDTSNWQFLKSSLAEKIETIDFSPEKLGEILIRQNILAKKDLEWALFQQKLNPTLKIGEILVHNNLISLSQLKFYLKNQNIKLGRILIERKIVTKNSIKRALFHQRDTHIRLGEILLQYKKIRRDQLDEALVEQYIRRKGLFLIEDKFNDRHLVFQEKPPLII